MDLTRLPCLPYCYHFWVSTLLVCRDWWNVSGKSKSQSSAFCNFKGYVSNANIINTLLALFLFILFFFDKLLDQALHDREHNFVCMTEKTTRVVLMSQGR